MPDEGLARSLEGEDEVRITFSKRDGKKRTIPVWFTVKEGTLELLPMYGLKTKWFEDVQAAGSLTVGVGRSTATRSPTILRDAGAVDRIKQRFASKYGEGDVRSYYPTSEVALELEL